MKKKLFAIPLALGMAISIASCGSDAKTSTKESTTDVNTTTVETTTETTAKLGSYTIRVYDIDNELLGEEVLSLKDYPTFMDGFNAKFDVAMNGTFVSSVNHSVVDSNYFLAIYENGQMASTGADGLVADDGDVFEFKNECWNTKESGYGSFDSYDVLVDKIIYHYAKTTLKTSLNSSTSYLDSTYWQAMALNLMMDNKYDSNLFNNSLFTEEYKKSITDANVSDLPNASSWASDANYAKWYYAARLFDTDTTSFEAVFSSYLESLTAYGSEYVMPFNLSIAKELGLDSKIADAVKSPSTRPGVDYGTDGLAWALTGLALYNTLEDSELTSLSLENIQKAVSKGYANEDVSLATFLLPYAAMNKNAREFKVTEDKDILAYLIDNHFDSNTYQFDTEKLGENDYSSNQIYAALMAYKVQRDQSKGVVLFA